MEGVKLGYQLEVVSEIYNAYERQQHRTPRGSLRPHLGASLIARECSRQLWYTFRWALSTSHPGRLLRLFETGHLEEPRMVDNLRNIGVIIHEIDPITKKQFSVNFFGGHFSGSLDGCGFGIPCAPEDWHVLEFKTHSEKSFKKLEDDGVKKTKFEHYSQMNIYMGGTGMPFSLYLAKNKNTDHLYAERTVFDEKLFQAHLAKAENIIFTSVPPGRIANEVDSQHCRYCDYKSICHEGVAVMENCRTCKFSIPIDDGTWRCLNDVSIMNNGDPLNLDQQFRGCDEWEGLM